jgi:hypothetical protein
MVGALPNGECGLQTQTPPKWNGAFAGAIRTFRFRELKRYTTSERIKERIANAQ